MVNSGGFSAHNPYSRVLSTTMSFASVVNFHIFVIVVCGRVVWSSQDNPLRFQPHLGDDTLAKMPALHKLSTAALASPTSSSHMTSVSSNRTFEPFDPIISSCMAFIDVFSEAAANYTHCALQNARPLTFCQNCAESYLRANYNYRIIMEGGPKDDKGQLCRDLILNSDRIRIVVRLGQFVEDLWTDCHCGLCYSSLRYDRGNVVANFSRNMLQFMELAENTTTCLNNFTYAPLGSNISVACDACCDVYHAMNSFYDDWEDKDGPDLCVDVVDMMNTTRQEWSVTFKCHANPGPIWSMLLVTSILCMWPVIFYSGIRIFNARQRSNIMKQHRIRLSRSLSVAPHLFISRPNNPATTSAAPINGTNNPAATPVASASS